MRSARRQRRGDGRRHGRRQGRRARATSPGRWAEPRTSSAPTRWPAGSAPVPAPRGPTCSRAGPGWSSPSPSAEPDSLARAHALVALCGGVAVTMDAAAHDAAVALVSHVPQVAASLVAARLAEGAEDAALALTGQGLRDVTRVAASDPDLWVDILAANAEPVAQILTELRADVDARRRARCTSWPRTPSGAGPRCARCSSGATPAGPGCRASTARRSTSYAVVPVVLADRPGELARLFADAGAAGVNIEDIRIEHSPGQPVGLVELAVAPRWPRPAGRGARRARLGGARLRPGSLGVSPPARRPCRGSACPRPATAPTAPGTVSWSPSTARPARASPACPRGVARRLGLRYLDTGAMYRALTWWMLEQRRRRARRRRGRGRPAGSPHRGRAPTRRHPRSRSTAATSPARSATRDVTAAVSAGQRGPRRPVAAGRPAARDRSAPAASSSRDATSAPSSRPTRRPRSS